LIDQVHDIGRLYGYQVLQGYPVQYDYVCFALLAGGLCGAVREKATDGRHAYEQKTY
jgi:hypothetical protein